MLKKNKKLLTVLLALAVSSVALTACNTVGGAGKDIENAGEGVQRAAHK